MTFDEIETFLAVVEHTNIARAADQLYIGQGTASSRIQHIEQELGISLFFRRKGIKTVTLTPEGEIFFSIAQQWISLLHQAQQIKNRLVFRELRVASVDALNYMHFRKLYQTFMKKNPGIQLYLQTEHATEAYQLIEQQSVDMAFVFILHESHNVLAHPLFKESCVLLYHKDMRFDKTHNFADLPLEGEVYPTMGRDFDLWHNRVFSNSDVRKVSIGTLSMLPDFICEKDTWSVVPQSCADLLVSRDDRLTYISITEDPPPMRTAYVLFYQYAKPWTQELCELFLKDVIQMIKETPSLTLLYHENTLDSQT